MKVTITSLELRSPLHFFALSYRAMKIMMQLQKTPCVKKRTRGFWTKHYTMTLWNSENDLKDFAKVGAHLTAMKDGKSVAKEIRTLTYEANSLPSWKDAKALIHEKGKVTRYN